MCGRFALWAQDLEDQINAMYPFVQAHPYEPPADEGGAGNQAEFHPRYNIAPRSMSPVIRRVEVDRHPGAVLQLMKWGIIPHWQKHENNNLSTINARSEALVDNEPGMWAQLKGKKRCVVPVNGYFEWLKKGNQRIPYYMKYKDPSKPLLFAGMWESTTLEGDKYPTYTFTIITTSSSSQLSFIHDRMPVILESEEDIKLWLDPSKGWSKELAVLLKPYEHPIDVYAVPKEVGKVGTNDPSFVQPVAERKDGIAAMFKKQQEKLKSPEASSSKSTQDSDLASPPEASSSSPTKSSGVSESERMTLGDAKKARKRAAEEDDDDVALVEELSPTKKKAKKKSAKQVDSDPEEASPRKKVKREEDTASPKKKRPKSNPSPKKLPPQKAKITDFFKK